MGELTVRCVPTAQTLVLPEFIPIGKNTYTREEVFTVALTFLESLLAETHSADKLALAALDTARRILDRGISKQTGQDIMAWLCKRIERERRQHPMVTSGMF